MSKPETKNEKNWQKIFEKYDVLNKIDRIGSFEISANQIKEFREPRLMTKFDHRESLPCQFSDNKLSILPLTRGTYIIANFDAYHNLETIEQKKNSIVGVTIPNNIETIDFENITSESTAINAAFVSDMLSDFLEEESFYPTVSGRMSSQSFDFCINTLVNSAPIELSVNNSQIEIDGGFESANSLYILECKNSVSDNFLIRQLYYPYRLWNTKIRKNVVPIFFQYSNGIFQFYQYAFGDLNMYNSIHLIKHRRYAFEPEEISINDIMHIFHHVELTNEPEIPFPQADSFERVINLCEILNENSSLSKQDITYRYGFDERQTNYYADAGRYLGLIDKNTNSNNIIVYSLSSLGNSLFKTSSKNRNLKYCQLILVHKPFYLVFKDYIEHNERPKKSQIVKHMKSSNIYHVEKDSTFKRRASSVISWIEWILDLART